MKSTILSDRNAVLKTVRPLTPMDYDEGCVLTAWTHCGAEMVALDRDELLALVRVLPTPLLLRVLGERGLTQDLAFTEGGPVVDTGFYIRIGLNDADRNYVKLTQSEFAVGKQRAREEQAETRTPNPFFGLDDPAPCEER